MGPREKRAFLVFQVHQEEKVLLVLLDPMDTKVIEALMDWMVCLVCREIKEMLVTLVEMVRRVIVDRQGPLWVENLDLQVHQVYKVSQGPREGMALMVYQVEEDLQEYQGVQDSLVILVERELQEGRARRVILVDQVNQDPKDHLDLLVNGVCQVFLVQRETNVFLFLESPGVMEHQDVMEFLVPVAPWVLRVLVVYLETV